VNVEDVWYDVVKAVVVVSVLLNDVESTVPHVPDAVKFPVPIDANVAIL
jgi:hypothetical protein